MSGSILQSFYAVDDSGATSATRSVTCTGITAGSALLVVGAWGNAAGITATCSDGTSYTSVNPGKVLNSTDNQNSQVYILEGSSVGSGTHTVALTFSVNAAFGRIRVLEIAGILASGSVDQGAGQGQNTVGTTTDSISSGNMAATTNAADFLVAFTQDTTNVDPGSGTMAAGTNFTLNGSNQILAAEGRNVVATGTYAGTFTDSKNSNRTTHVVALKTAAASGVSIQPYVVPWMKTVGGIPLMGLMPPPLLPTLAAVSTTYTLNPGGSIVFSGAAAELRTRVQVPTGSIVFSGSPAQIHTRVQEPSGSIVYSGSAAQLHTKVYTPAGQIVFSGSAALSFTSGGTVYTISPTGSIVYSGTALEVKTRVQVPSGSIVFSGAAPQVRTRIDAPTGQIVFNGSSSMQFIPAGTVTDVPQRARTGHGL